MSDENSTQRMLKTGEYFLSDPAVLQGMQTMYDIKTPGFETLIACQRTPITERLIQQLHARGIETIFAEPALDMQETISSDGIGKTKAITTEYAPYEFATNDDISNHVRAKTLAQSLELFKFFSKRKEQRYSIEKRISFVLESGITCVGRSKNISQSAVLLVVENNCNVNPNEYGKIIINHMGNACEFNCSVVRTEKIVPRGYHVALRVHGKEARDFLSTIILSSTKCYNCGSTENLEQCPKCKGINTICSACLIRENACKPCRADDLKYESRNIV